MSPGPRRLASRVRGHVGAARPRARSPVVKLVRATLELERGFVYLVDPEGDVARVRMAGSRVGRPRKVLRLGLAREPGFLYFVDRDGDVARVPTAT